MLTNNTLLYMYYLAFIHSFIVEGLWVPGTHKGLLICWSHYSFRNLYPIVRYCHHMISLLLNNCHTMFTSKCYIIFHSDAELFCPKILDHGADMIYECFLILYTLSFTILIILFNILISIKLKLFFMLLVSHLNALTNLKVKYLLLYMF